MSSRRRSALNPQLCHSLEPLIFGVLFPPHTCVHTSLFACYSWHTVTFPRWRLIQETSSSAPCARSLFTGQERLLTLLPGSPRRRTHCSQWVAKRARVRRLGRDKRLNAQIDKFNSSKFHGRHGALCAVKSISLGALSQREMAVNSYFSSLLLEAI